MKFKFKVLTEANKRQKKKSLKHKNTYDKQNALINKKTALSNHEDVQRSLEAESDRSNFINWDKMSDNEKYELVRKTLNIYWSSDHKTDPIINYAIEDVEQNNGSPDTPMMNLLAEVDLNKLNSNGLNNLEYTLQNLNDKQIKLTSYNEDYLTDVDFYNKDESSKDFTYRFNIFDNISDPNKKKNYFNSNSNVYKDITIDKIKDLPTGLDNTSRINWQNYIGKTIYATVEDWSTKAGKDFEDSNRTLKRDDQKVSKSTLDKTIEREIQNNKLSAKELASHLEKMDKDTKHTLKDAVNLLNVK